MSQDETKLPQNSRYNRPRVLVSWVGLFIGVLLGGGMGFYYAWYINPVVEVDTRPWQLETESRVRYIAAIALSFSHNSDLNRATTRLLSVMQPRSPQDPLQEMADAACEMAQSGYANTQAGFREVRSMVNFYRLQGRSGCADELLAFNATPADAQISITLPTPTPLPPATKTPTVVPTNFPTPTAPPIAVPTALPQQYVLVNVATFCDTTLSGIIEVYVQNFNGTGIPGEPIRVRWEGGADTFYTGLKPERGAAYADFTMTENVAYTIEMPNRSSPSTQQLVAVPCTTESGARAITSYRAVFRPN